MWKRKSKKRRLVMVKKMLFTFLSIFLMLLISNNVSAQQFLEDWYLDIDGPGGYSPIQINEYFDTTGSSYINNTLLGGGPSFSFEEWGFFATHTHDSGTLYPWISDYELTAIFHANGTGTLGGSINFDDGYLEIYVDNSTDYGNITSSSTPGVYYGANDGILIASFEVVSGSGIVDTTGIPNGEVTVVFESTYIRPGYFFDENMNDLSNLPLYWVLGYSTTNASWVQNPRDELVTELENFSGQTVNNDPPNDLVISGNGQYRLAVVPEPATFMLLGAGMLMVGTFIRRKKSN